MENVEAIFKTKIVPRLDGLLRKRAELTQALEKVKAELNEQETAVARLNTGTAELMAQLRQAIQQGKNTDALRKQLMAKKADLQDAQQWLELLAGERKDNFSELETLLRQTDNELSRTFLALTLEHKQAVEEAVTQHFQNGLDLIHDWTRCMNDVMRDSAITVPSGMAALYWKSELLYNKPFLEMLRSYDDRFLKKLRVLAEV